MVRTIDDWIKTIERGCKLYRVTDNEMIKAAKCSMGEIKFTRRKGALIFSAILSSVSGEFGGHRVYAEITKDGNCKCGCACPEWKYFGYAYWATQFGNAFYYTNNIYPQMRNPNAYLSGCHHVLTMLRYIKGNYSNMISKFLEGGA